MLRRFANFVAGTFLTGSIDDSQTNLPVNSTAGFPAAPFVLAIANDGLGGGELVLCTEVVDGTNFTVERGFDGTAPAAASENDLVEHTTGAIDYREAGIVRIDTTERDALAGEDLWDGRVVYNEDTDGLDINRAVGGWDALAVLPVGAMIPFTALTLPTGFLWADGAAVLRSSYPALNALYNADGYPFGAGDESTTFNLPDMSQRFPLGLTDSGAGSEIGETGGAIDHVHLHTHAAGTLSAVEAGAHTHTNPSTSSEGHTHSNPSTSSDSHSHSTPSTSSAGNHNHSVGDTSDAVVGTAGLGSTPGLHSRGNLTHNHSQASTGSAGSHSHSFQDTVSTTQSHTHQASGTTGSGGSHSHSTANTSTFTPEFGSSHNHTNPNTGTGGSHSHTLGNTGSDAHSHTQGNTGSHSHSHTQGDTGSSGAHTHTTTGSTAEGGGSAGANPPYLTVPWIVRH